MPLSSLVSGTAPTATASQRPAVSPAKIPIPPTSGVGRSCQRSTDGAASTRPATGVRSSSQTVRRAAGKAASAAIVLTNGEGRRAVLGPCLPTRRIPRLVRADDGLRRSGPLPRAVRQPLPPRLPGEVQRLAARHLLVAPESPGPARRLPGRVRGAPADAEDDPALPAVPAGRNRLLDLLLGLAPVRVPVDGRQRGADPEGAVPAAARRVLDGGDAGGHLRGDDGDPGRALARVRARSALDRVARNSARGRLRRLRAELRA